MCFIIGPKAMGSMGVRGFWVGGIFVLVVNKYWREMKNTEKYIYLFFLTYRGTRRRRAGGGARGRAATSSVSLSSTPCSYECTRPICKDESGRRLAHILVQSSASENTARSPAVTGNDGTAGFWVGFFC